MKVYSLLDRKMRTFGQLLYAPTDGAMFRMIYDSLKDTGTMMEKYPEDFDLFSVGEFNEENGALSGIPPVLVCPLSGIMVGKVKVADASA